MPGTHHLQSTPRLSLICTLLFMMVLLFAIPVSADDSGCVVCHTDEDLLLENLGEQTQKKSALQAGAG